MFPLRDCEKTDRWRPTQTLRLRALPPSEPRKKLLAVCLSIHLISCMFQSRFKSVLFQKSVADSGIGDIVFM